MTTIRISTATPSSPGYDVIVETGALQHLADRLTRVVPVHRYAIITDHQVARRWGDSVVEGLRAAGLNADLIVFDAGERSKTRETWARLTDEMLERRFGRDSCVIALGGGVAGDLAGFVAATYMRGVPIVQVPTTLLAMIDASVGGKTGVDAPAGKNLVGAFNSPSLVVADPATLKTLPRAELVGGMAEAIKHGAIADAGYFQWLVDNAAALLDAEADLMSALIAGSVRIKAGFVSVDLHEQGARAALNFGHTIGHAIEHALEYGIHHGQAVALGMVAEARAGELQGVTEPGTARRLEHALDRMGLPIRLPATASADLVLASVGSDKKARAGRVRYVLLARLGEVARGPAGEWTFDLPPATLRAALTQD